MGSTYDIAIVGAGILGSFAAYHAAKRGMKVLLIEAGKSPTGATVRNFGQAVPSGQSLNGWRQLGIKSTEIYKQVATAGNIPFQQNGSLYVASNDAEAQLLEEMQHINASMGYDSRLLDKKSSLEHTAGLNTSYVKSALFYPQEITLDSPIFMEKFLKILADIPEITYVNSVAVTALEESSHGAQLRFASGDTATANQALVCCGHQLNRITGMALDISRLEISRLQMLACAVNPAGTVKGNLLTGLTIRRYEAFHACPSYSLLRTPPDYQEYVNQGIHILFKQAANGELIVGDSHHYYRIDEADSLDFATNEHTNKLMLNEAKKILPHANLTITRSWNGFYSQDRQNGFYSRSYSKSIHLVTGIGGKGMTTGPALMAEVIAMLHKGDGLNDFYITE